MQAAGKFYKKHQKKILITVIMALLLCSLSSCGQPKGSGDGGESSHAGSGELSWRARRVTLDRQYASAAISEDMIYACAYEDEKVVLDCLRKNSVVIEEKVQTEITLKAQFILPEISTVSKMSCDDKGSIYILGKNLADYDCFWKVTAQGVIHEAADLFAQEEKSIRFARPKGIFTDASGDHYVWYNLALPKGNDAYYFTNLIYGYDDQLNQLCCIEIPEDELLSVHVSEFGEFLLLCKDRDGIYIREINADITENKRYFESSEEIISYDFLIPETDGFLFCEGSLPYDLGHELYRFGFDTQSAEKILDLSDFGIFASDILQLRMEEGYIEIIENPETGKNSDLVVLSVQEGTKESDETILTLGIISQDYALDDIVTAFNRRGDIRIETRYYSEYGDFADALEHLTLDVAAGKGPDIVDVCEMDYDFLAQKGVFSDLYEFMQEDEELNRSMLISSVLKAYEMGGKLYNIAPAFQIKSMWGSKKLLGNREGVTMAELMQILTENGRDLNAIDGFTRSPLIELCITGMDEFIDWENGICNFEGENFKDVLAFAKEYKGGYMAKNKMEAVRQGEILLTNGTLYNITDYQFQKELYGDELSFIGYPALETSGTLVSFYSNQLAINAAGKKPEAAWEFVKYYVLHGYEMRGFPTVKEQFDKVMEQSMEEEYDENADGTLNTEVRIPKASYSLGDGSRMSVYAASEEDINVLKQLVDNIKSRYKYHSDILAIINEEAEYYYQGQKSVDEVAKIIQSRVSLWLQEQM